MYTNWERNRSIAAVPDYLPFELALWWTFPLYWLDCVCAFTSYWLTAIDYNFIESKLVWPATATRTVPSVHPAYQRRQLLGTIWCACGITTVIIHPRLVRTQLTSNKPREKVLLHHLSIGGSCILQGISGGWLEPLLLRMTLRERRELWIATYVMPSRALFFVLFFRWVTDFAESPCSCVHRPLEFIWSIEMRDFAQAIHRPGNFLSTTNLYPWLSPSRTCKVSQHWKCIVAVWFSLCHVHVRDVRHAQCLSTFNGCWHWKSQSLIVSMCLIFYIFSWN